MTHYFRDEYAKRFLSLKDAKAKLRKTLHEEPVREVIEIKTNEAITLDEARRQLKSTLSGKSYSQEVKLDSAGTDWQECSDAALEKIKQEQLLAARKKLRKTLSSSELHSDSLDEIKANASGASVSINEARAHLRETLSKKQIDEEQL